MEDLEIQTAKADTLQVELDRLRSSSEAALQQLRRRPAPPPALARRLQAQVREVEALTTERDAAHQRCQALEQSENALVEAATQLRRQVDSLQRRITHLREERDSLQVELDTAVRERDQAVERQQIEVDRTFKARSDLHAHDQHLNSMRSSISRLEQQVGQWCSTSVATERRLAAAEQGAASLRRSRDLALQGQDDDVRDRDAVVTDYRLLQDHYADAYNRFSAVAAAMGQNVDLPNPSGLAQHALSGSAGPRRARKTQRTATASFAARNTPSSRSQSPARKSPIGGAMADEDDDVGSIGGGSPVPPPIDRSDEGASSAEEGSPDQDDADAPPARPLMTRSLPARRTMQTRRCGCPLSLSVQSTSPQFFDRCPSDDSGDAELDRASDDGQGGDLPADEDDTSAGQDNSTEIDEDDEASLPSTTVPRGLWIPGYRVHRLFRTADVTPWDVDKVSHQLAVEIDVPASTSLLLDVSAWLFPTLAPSAHPHPSTYEHLITGAAVDVLMNLSPPPWVSLDNEEAPLTFIPHLRGRMPHNFAQAYLEYEERHLQSIWGSTHTLPITEAMCLADPLLAAYHEQRRQRRSRAGVAWRQFLAKYVVPAIRRHLCDIDILLDPFFLHFPKPRVLKEWYPRLTGNATTLANTLEILDAEEPWRLQYRLNPQDHPAMQIARLAGKFIAPQ
ncbi:hypothetical protein PF003_g15623 [Phytophthora fragariae]|nr:hypothetical protein PF003_g15623 [Phytophthora fragariae]